jgi:Protein of unknown function (DUF1592)/Protein of unknown function (DUF1588)/Protein of unknown function (DUF1595)/Protein of unknown function (DUF1585)
MRFSDKIGPLALGCVLAAACTGNIGTGGGSPGQGTGTPGAGSSTGATGGSPGASTGGGGSGGGNAGAPVTGPASLLNLPASPLPGTLLHKLTAWEFANSLQDLLGSGVPLSPVEADTLIGGFATVGASSVAISPAGIGTYETVVGAATAYAFGDPTRASAILACVPTSTADTACLTKAINTFGRRAFRRPLDSDDTARFLNIATSIGSQTGATVLDGVRHAVWAMLESPSFLYRVELGAASASDGGRLKYNSFEMASRLAATIWASVPDDVLLDAAVQDALSTPAGAIAQAQRMIADPRAHRSVSAFVDQLYDAFALSQAQKDPATFPAYTPTLQAAMLREIEMRVDDMTFTQKGDYLSLFDSRSTFVNKELASFYGVPFTATDGAFHPVNFPNGSPRVGILGAAAILAGHAHSLLTSPTHRGKFVDEMLLCKTVPPPPPGVPPLPSIAPPGSTVRQMLTAHRSQPMCASCHGLMDPIGFAMESFDASGQYRTTDNGQAIDSSGTLDGMAFSNLAELESVLRKEAVAGPCVASKLYENALGRLPTNADGAALGQLITAFTASGNRIDQLLANLVGNDGYRFVAP